MVIFLNVIKISFGGNLGYTQNKNLDEATFGAGCFWCVEAVFEELEGVIEVQAGYTGGNTINPSYEDVCSGKTGHAEVINIRFDSNIVSFDSLLNIFWKVHDPTTLNRQGGDVGTQYRSVIFYHSKEQKSSAEKSKQFMDSAECFPNPIVTEISPLKEYYPAENYHQDYYKNNPNAPYCQLVIKPKLEKLKIK